MAKQALTKIEDALQQILVQVPDQAESESLAISSACGRVLAENIKADINVPAYDNSAMDGFAVHTDAVRKTDVELPISQVIPAGKTGDQLKTGTAARIFTGAPIPPGANAVILQEDTEYDDVTMKILEVPHAGKHIRLKGHDIKAGETILEQGHRLKPQDIGLLASLGIEEIKVFKPLRVAVLNTGDELVAPGEPLQPGQIYESNSYTLSALLISLGLEVVKKGIVKDNLDSTRTALLEAADEADCIISSGGVSVGEADFVKSAIEETGELTLWKLAVKPGKPFSFGKVGATPFFGLPGNPVAVFVTFLMLVKPFLLAMQGASQLQSEPYLLPAGFSQEEAGSRQEYIRVRLGRNQQGFQELIPFSNQGSSVMTSTSWADGLAIIPINTQIKKGDLLEFLPFTSLL